MFHPPTSPAPSGAAKHTMTISRDWATPLTIGAFLLLATTGVLMFFHLDTGLNKAAHEWLGWVLLAGAGLHVAANFFAFRRHLGQARARWVIGAFALVLGLSFLPLGGSDKPPFFAPVQALAGAPLPVIAAAARISPAQARERLVAAGVAVPEGDGPVPALASAGLGQQMRLLNAVLGTAAH